MAYEKEIHHHTLILSLHHKYDLDFGRTERGIDLCETGEQDDQT